MTEYGQDFFDLVTSGASLSARQLVPIVKDIVKPKSVLDVGGGNGAWLSEWLNTGLDDGLCVDGDYVDTEKLLIPQDKFQAHDLTTPLNLKRKFDLVMSLEVAEHLDEKFAKDFVKSLTRHSDVIFFSAALPGQTGVHHVNERWMSYWSNIFKSNGYNPYDVLRPVIWNVKDIEMWYRQNCIIFANAQAAKRLNLKASTASLDIVHPELFTYHLNLQKSVPVPETIEVKVVSKNKSRIKNVLKNSPAGPTFRRLNSIRRSIKP